MLFNSIDFLVFFPLVVLGFGLVPKKLRYIWLLIASYYFYMSWNPRYALLIAASTLITYGCALLIAGSDRPGRKKLWVAAGLISNLVILCVFKYANFALENVAMVARMLGISESTSASQLFRAKNQLARIIKAYNHQKQPPR